MKIDPRKRNSAATREKKSAAGRSGKVHKNGDEKLQERIELVVKMAEGFIVFAPKICKSEARLRERIELVVKMAEMAQTVPNTNDVIRHNRSPLLYRSLGAHKIA